MRKSARILDLACGPGSTSLALLAILPDAHIVAVDKDPILLAIAREVFARKASVEVRDADLDHIEWLESLDGPLDAVVSSTALHWLKPDALSRLYFALAGKIREGGMFLNADHLLYDDISQPRLLALARIDDESNQKSAFEAGVESWESWWESVETLPAYAEAAAKRKLIWQNKAPTPDVTLGFHFETLRSAGFRETGTIWQYLDDFVVCAIR